MTPTAASPVTSAKDGQKVSRSKQLYPDVDAARSGTMQGVWVRLFCELQCDTPCIEGVVPEPPLASDSSTFKSGSYRALGTR